MSPRHGVAVGDAAVAAVTGPLAAVEPVSLTTCVKAGAALPVKFSSPPYCAVML